MATTYQINGGRVTAIPGVYSSVDTSALVQTSLTSTGTVALLGTAVGGRPYTAITGPADFVRITQPSQVRKVFRGGDLLEAATIAFDASSDTNVGSAQQVIAMKVNPATAATAVLPGAQGPALRVTSLDYGEFANHIGISIGQGSEKGLMVSIETDASVETGDNLGGDASFKLTYSGGSHGWQGMTTGVTTGGEVYADATLKAPSLAGSIAGQPSAPAALGFIYDPKDLGLAVAVYGVDADDKGIAEVVTLAPDVQTKASFAKVFGAACWAAANKAVITIQTADGATNVITLGNGQQFAGVQPLSYAYVAQASVTATGTSSGANALMLVPAGNTGSAEMLTLDGTNAIRSQGSYAQLAGIVTGGLGTQGATIAARAVSCQTAAQKTVGAIISYFDARSVSVDGTIYGFDATLADAAASAPAGQIDAASAVNCLAPAEATFTANLYAVINFINSNSALVTATVADGAVGAPVPTQTPVFLSGGTEGIATFQDWQNALNLLQQVTVDIIVPLSCDPAIAAALDAHCAFMNSPAGANERSGIVGLMNGSLTGLPTKKEMLAQAQALNTRNLSAVGQALVRFDSTGTLQVFNPQFLAVAAAGMASGASVGTSLTRKLIKATSLVTHPSWSTTLDAEEILQGGVLFARLRDGQGFQWVRDLTTYLQADNLAYVERSVNAVCNTVVRGLRQACDFAIGKPAFAGTAAALQSVLTGQLALYIQANTLTGYTSPVITQVADRFEIELNVAPILPTNFIQLSLAVSASSGT